MKQNNKQHKLPKKTSKIIEKLARFFFIDIFLDFLSLRNRLYTDYHYSTIKFLKSSNLSSKMVALNKEITENSSQLTALLLAYKVFKVYLWEICLCIILYIIDVLSKIGVSLMLANVITSLNKKENLLALHYSIGLIFLMIIHLFSGQHNWYLLNKLSNSLKLSILSALYSKTLKLSTSKLELEKGKLYNIISSDMNLLENKASYLLAILMTPFTLIVSIGLLIYNFNNGAYYILFGLIIIFSLQYITAYLNVKTLNKKAQACDSRIKSTNELLEQIRIIKMLGWEDVFIDEILNKREKEVGWLESTNILLVSNKILAKIAPFILTLILLSVYKGASMAQRFSTYQLLDFVSVYTILYFGLGLLSFFEYRLVFQRLSNVLNVSESTLFQKINNEIDSNSIEIRNFAAEWIPGKKCLNSINLTIKKKEKIAFIGKIASGKTSLFLSILNQIPKTEGNIEINGSLAFVEQNPFLIAGSLRENILFGLNYDKIKYEKILKACLLDEDFKLFPKGDSTLVGERGVCLSGGQKSRVSFARALYLERDIYLLDDPFSALDSKTALRVFQRTIESLLIEKTVLLITHRLDFLNKMNNVYIFNEGKIELVSHEKNIISEKFAIYNEEQDEKDELNKKNHKIDYLSNDIEKGEIKFSLIIKYLLMGKSKILIISIILFIISEILRFVLMRMLALEFNDWIIYFLTGIISFIFINILKNLFLQKTILSGNSKLHESVIKRVSHAQVHFFEQQPVGRILGRFSSDLGLIDSMLLFGLRDALEFIIAYINFMITIIYTCNRLFFLTCLLLLIYFWLYKIFKPAIIETKKRDLAAKSPVFSFFAESLVGLMTIKAYDQQNSFILKYKEIIIDHSNANLVFWGLTRIYTFLLEFTGIIFCGLSIICMTLNENIDEGLAAQSAVSLVLMTEIVQYGFNLAINIELLMNSIMRLFRYQRLKICRNQRIRRDLIIKKDTNKTDCLSLNRKFKLILIKIAKFLNFQSNNNNQNLNYISMNMKNNSIEKEDHIVLSPMLSSSSPCNCTEINAIDAPITSPGEITFFNVSLRYSNSNLVLNKISFHINKGEKIGCVGRTGAGKSSLINLLFGLVNPEKDSIISINGKNLNYVSSYQLHNEISIIPQQSFVFSGTIKKNLDPTNEYSDFEIWQSLETVNLKEFILNLPLKLNTIISDQSIFSSGQRQLLGMARVLLKNNKIIVLDEATSSVDLETEEFIHKKIKDKLHDCTLFIVAHRLITIADCDKVLVMKNGEIAEFDNPKKLLKIGFDSVIYGEGEFADMVKCCSKETREKIIEKLK